jgi:hypothetical protein
MRKRAFIDQIPAGLLAVLGALYGTFCYLFGWC